MGGKNSFSQKTYLLQLGLAFVGLLLSVYLLVQHTRLVSGIQDSASLCSTLTAGDCDSVLASQYSKFFGVPLPTFGALLFWLLLLIGLLSPPKSSNFRKGQSLLAWLCVGALLYDLYLVGVQIFVLRTACLFCLSTYILQALHLMAGVYTTKRLGIERPFFHTLFPGSAPGFIASKETATLSFLSTLFLAWALLLLPSAVWLKSDFYAFVKNATERFYEQWVAESGHVIPLSEEDARSGNPSAKVKIVEFSDLECPHCKKAAFVLNTVLKSMPGKTELIFKHYPLDPSCNSNVERSMHPNACKLAQLAYCATQKKRFKEFHDTIFFHLPETRTADWSDIRKAIKDIFTEDEISQCLINPKSLKKVREDIALASSLNVNGTPAIFLNGKWISIPLTVDTLQKLIELELNH